MVSTDFQLTLGIYPTFNNVFLRKQFSAQMEIKTHESVESFD